MSLFPSCTFRVEVQGGHIIPGEQLRADLVLEVPKPIPRAEQIDLLFQTVAWAGYGSGKSRAVTRRNMFQAPLHVRLPPGAELPAGTHRYPFTVDLPPWLPPGFVGEDCGIEHTIRTLLDVAWALDPKATLTPTITPRPSEATRAGLILRSPPGFHGDVVVEITLESTVVGVNEPIRGQVALRSGLNASFNGIDLTIASTAVIVMGRHDRRHTERMKLHIDGESLRHGEAAAFTFPPIAGLRPTFRTSFIDHDVTLLVSLDLPWARDPRFSVLLNVLPTGSILHGAGVTNIVGSERLRRLGAAMARATGLEEGVRPHELVRGKIGSVSLSLLDAPRAAKLGVGTDITFPDVELGIHFRQAGLLDAFSESPLLPPTLTGYALRFEPPDARRSPSTEARKAFIDALLGELGGTTELRLSDHHLSAHLAIESDDETSMVAIAQAAHALAERIDKAIAALPFPVSLGAFRPAWEATAREQNALLVPTGPTIHRLAFQARISDGEERVAHASLRTMWTEKTPTLQVDLNLDHAAIPETARKKLDRGEPIDALAVVRSHFEIVHVAEDGRSAMLAHAGWPEDPRSILPAIEAFFSWVLAARGERRVEMPYR